MKAALFVLGLVIYGVGASNAYAGDAAMLIFKSGQVVKIDDGFRQISEALKRGQDSDGKSSMLELNLGSGTFLLNVAEVAVACRDDCSGITVMHQLDPKRAGYNTKIGIDQSRLEINPARGPKAGAGYGSTGN